MLALVADAVLLVHVLVAAFAVAGLALICAGGARGWPWVRNPWFRAAHASLAGVVAAQAWLGAICPLTTLEMALRARAGDAVYAGGAIAHWLAWLAAVLYWRAPPWVFVAGYTAFAVLTAAAWVLVRPRPFRPAAR